MHAAGLVCVAFVAAGCSSVRPDPLQLDAGVLTVDNRTPQEWRNVEIWLNRSFRASVPSIAASSRFQVPLDGFVSGYAQRFDRQRMMVNDLRLSAQTSDGSPVALEKQFEKSGLAALGGRK
jgi:hypothetical protein